MQKRNEQEWRKEILQHCDLDTKEVNLAGIRTIVTKANPDFEEKEDSEVLADCDIDADGIVSYEDMVEYLKQQFQITVAPWDSGHVPTLQGVPEEDENAEGSRDARGRSEFHRLAATVSETSAEQIEKMLNEDCSLLSDKDADGMTPRELAKNEGANDNVQNIDRLVLKWIYDGVVNGQTDMLDTLVFSGYQNLPDVAALTESDLFTQEQIEQFGQYVEDLQGKRSAFFEAVTENNVSKVEEMLTEYRRLLSARDSRGMGVIHAAVADNKPEVVKFLKMNHGSIVTLRDALGRTAVSLAQSIEDEAERDVIVKLLTEQGVTFSEEAPAVQQNEGGEETATEEQPEATEATAEE